MTALQAREEANFAAGDILNAAGDIRITTLAGMVGRSADYLRQLKRVSATFPPESRALDHSWSVHRLAAYTDEPERVLSVVVGEGLSVRTARDYCIAQGLITPRPKSDSGQVSTCPACGHEWSS